MLSLDGMFEKLQTGEKIHDAPRQPRTYLLMDIPGVMVYLDDMLLSGKTDCEHLPTLEAVLHRLARAGFHLKKEKCTFMVSIVTYLGFWIDAEGLNTVTEKPKQFRMPLSHVISQL